MQEKPQKEMVEEAHVEKQMEISGHGKRAPSLEKYPTPDRRVAPAWWIRLFSTEIKYGIWKNTKKGLCEKHG